MDFFRSYGSYHGKEKQRLLSWLNGLDPGIKRMIIMRINFVIFFLTFTLMNVSASVNAQNISLSVKDAPLTEVLKLIQQQSGFHFIYDNADIKRSKPITLSLKNNSLTDALDKCMSNQPLSYEIVDKNIVIKPKPESFKDKVIGFFKKLYITGKVLNEKGMPLPEVIVRVKGTSKNTFTDKDGRFSIEVPDENAILLFTFVGYQTQEYNVKDNASPTINLKVTVRELEEFSVVNTGYQSLPKERATGSFEMVDNKLLNRRISTNVLDRIENNVPGVLFDRSTNAPDPIGIRGRSTILSESSPLIVVDNFPFDGNINDINPNDVESITILKDASAASIWGARAGNGVIVITTKKGSTDKPKINIFSNITFIPKPSPSSLRTISSADYIDLEKTLFSKGFYSADELSLSHVALSPVVELLIAKRENKINPTLADNQIEALKSYNSNSEIEKHLYRTVINQQHQMNISGNTNFINYYFSSGFDKSPGVLVGDNGNSRITIRSSNIFQLTRNLTLEAGFNYVQNNTAVGNNPGYKLSAGGTKGLYPYARLTDDNGNPVSIVQNYRTGFIDDAIQKGLLNWNYSPIDDISKSQIGIKTKDFVLKSALSYKIRPYLNAEVIYQYQNIIGNNDADYTKDSYYTRNLINKYTQLNTQNNQITRPIPIGDIRMLGNSLTTSHQGRAQISYHQNFNRNEISAIGGMEVREEKGNSNTSQYYGYNPISSTFASSLDYTKLYPFFNNLNSSATIPTQQNIFGGTIDHFWSYFANASYNYGQKYILSGSVRTDASNLFGVKTNQKGVPLWSGGLAWQLDKESFYNFSWIPQVKIRATYGIQGNFSRAISALTTARYNTTSTGLTYATILNPPNEALRWEQVKMLNLGIDFSLKRNILSGSVEYYNKKASDLMGTAPIDPTTGLTDEGGVSTFLGNIANMAGHGFDFRLVSQNINKKLQWTTTVLFSYTNMYVSKYYMPMSATGNAYLSSSIYNPIEGRPLYSLLSYRSAGLDPTTGDPRGYLNGEISKDFAKIISTTSLSDMVYSGNRTPKYYGSLRNDFYYNNFSLSFTFSFKAGYYFRKNSIDYYSLFNRWTGSSDYAQRWIKPGDEMSTNVPSLIYPADNNRDSFYAYSEALIEKGDHIRLEDISFGYELNKNHLPKLPFTRAKVFVYANNLGIVWRANKLGLDPNFLDVPSLGSTIAAGLNVTF